MSKKNITLGIDVGGTNTALGFIDRSGQCMLTSSIPTNSSEPASMLVARLQAVISDLYKEISKSCELKGIGIGAPNANYYRGTVENPPNLQWGEKVNLVELFKKYYDLPIVITNDANAAAIGEMKFGAAKEMKNFIVITLGTGLGSGIVVNGDLLYGADGFAGEIGHTIVYPKGRQCGCGKRGCLETYVSATGLCRTVTEMLAERRDESELREVSFNTLTSKMIFEAAERSDRIALDAFDYTGSLLGMKLSDSVAHLEPEAIILFGGLASAGDLIFSPARKSLEENLFPIFRGKVKLLPSAIPEGCAAVLGAGALIWNELEKQKQL